jgi:DNA anti-recombination protein RmuC
MSDYRDLRNRDFAEQCRREGEELEEQAREFERAKRQRQRSEQREQYDALDALRDELQREVAALRAELHASHECQIEAGGIALGEMLEKVIDHSEKMVRKVEHELFSLVERRFGELRGRLDGLLLPERPRPKDFKFAGERDDGGPLDLPNPLPRRGLN